MTVNENGTDFMDMADRFLDAAVVLLKAGSTALSVNEACLHAYLEMQIDFFTNGGKSPMTEEMFDAMKRLVTETLADELDSIYRSSIVRKRKAAPVLKLVPGKSNRAVIER